MILFFFIYPCFEHIFSKLFFSFLYSISSILGANSFAFNCTDVVNLIGTNSSTEEDIDINIPAGIQNGEMIRMSGRGEAVPGGVAGDLYVKIHVKSDPEVTREGTTLYKDLHIKLSDALLGNTYKVETLDSAVDIKIPAGIKHGELLRIKNKGVPAANGNRGDFMVKVKIDLPQKLSRKARQLVEELKEEGI